MSSIDYYSLLHHSNKFWACPLYIHHTCWTIGYNWKLCLGRFADLSFTRAQKIWYANHKEVVNRWKFIHCFGKCSLFMFVSTFFVLYFFKYWYILYFCLTNFFLNTNSKIAKSYRDWIEFRELRRAFTRIHCESSKNSFNESYDQSRGRIWRNSFKFEQWDKFKSALF